MKIGIDGLNLLGSSMGVGRYLSNLLAELPSVSSSEDEYHVLANTRWTDQPVQDNQIRYRTLRSPKWMWKNIRLPTEQVFGPIELLFLPNYTIPLIPGGRCVVTIHDIIPLLFPEWSPPLERLRFSILVRRAALQADRVIAVSECTRRDLVRKLGVSDSRIRVIPLGVESCFRPSPEDGRRRFCSKYGLERPYLLSVGAMHPRRNIERLVAAFEHLVKTDGIKLDLLLAGVTFSGRYAEKIRNDIRIRGIDKRVRMLGYVPEQDMADLYSYAEAFVYPSLYEGFGLPVLEAMACGCPVAASRCEAVSEVAGSAALFMDPFDIESIHDVLRRILMDGSLRAELTGMGLARRQAFSFKRTAEETHRVFEEVLN